MDEPVADRIQYEALILTLLNPWILPPQWRW